MTLESLARHGLGHLPVGHDSGTPPRTMTDYRTGGTPWTVRVGPDRTILVYGFHLDPNELLGPCGTTPRSIPQRRHA